MRRSNVLGPRTLSRAGALSLALGALLDLGACSSARSSASAYDDASAPPAALGAVSTRADVDAVPSDTEGSRPSAPPAAEVSAARGGGGTKADEVQPLDRALATIDVAEIRSDVFFVASDLLEGRDTPSRGLQLAARYFRARLERLGWKPGAKDGYFYTYPLTQRKLDEAQCSTRFAAGEREVPLALGTDYFLSSTMEVFDSSLDAPVVWCGEGTKDELEKAAPKGKWAACLDSGQQGFRVARDAREAGAAGVVLVEAPDAKEPYALRFGRTLEELRRGSPSYPKKDGAATDRPREERTPRILVSRAAFERALALAGKSAADLKAGDELGLTLSETRKIDGSGTVQVENVCGFWPGKHPELAKEVILVTAHYDHEGINRRGEVMNGADDNGSGSSGMLAIAEALAAYGPMKRSVMLMWLSGEEKGLWGSRAWNDAPWLPEGCRALCNINIDMIGRNAPDKLLITPTSARKEFNGLVRLAESLAPKEGFPKLGSADDYYERSDHINFAKKGMPVAFLFSDVHEDYHRSTDDPEKLDYDKVQRVTRLVVRMLDGLQGEKLEL
jgi:hypothetical protein